VRWLVDGMNVIGSRPDGWWRDRDGAARRLVASLQELAARGEDEITVAFEGRPVPGLGEGCHGGVQVRYAPDEGRTRPTTASSRRCRPMPTRGP